MSLVRLRNKGVLGVNPAKTVIAGNVKLVCFDKTGTLTTLIIDV